MDSNFTPDQVLAEAERLARAKRQGATKAQPSRTATRPAVPAQAAARPRPYIRDTMPSLRYAPAWWNLVLGAAAAWFGTLLLLAVIGVSGAIWIIHLWLTMPPTPPAPQLWH
jgi:hypothetical protein